MEAVYASPDHQMKFNASTVTSAVPRDDSRDAIQQLDQTTPLGKLRHDIISVQHQVNVFLTERMMEAKTQALDTDFVRHHENEVMSKIQEEEEPEEEE